MRNRRITSTIPSGMKKFIAMLALAMVAHAASAQVVMHDYICISTIGASIYITSASVDEKVIVPPKEERKGITSMHRAAMTVVQEYEASGWELFSFDAYQRETETTARTIWIMRKPK
jgi:hypothetical protein